MGEWVRFGTAASLGSETVAAVGRFSPPALSGVLLSFCQILCNLRRKFQQRARVRRSKQKTSSSLVWGDTEVQATVSFEVPQQELGGKVANSATRKRSSYRPRPSLAPGSVRWWTRAPQDFTSQLLRLSTDRGLAVAGLRQRQSQKEHFDPRLNWLWHPSCGNEERVRRGR